MRFLILFALPVMLLGSVQNAFGCEAYCASMHRSFTQHNMFSADVEFYKLDAEVFKVQANSYVDLQRLCPDGYLLDSYERTYVRPAMMGAGAFIEEGVYLKKVLGYRSEQCMATVTQPGYTPQPSGPGNYPGAPVMR